MQLDSDIIIVGGGIVGSILALASARENLTVLLINSTKPQLTRRFDGRAYAVSHSSCRLLSSLGMSELLKKDGQDICSISISDGEAGKGEVPSGLSFDGTDIEVSPMSRMIEDRHLRKSLSLAIKKCNKIKSLTAQIEDVILDGMVASATDTNNNVYCSRMIVGCDGKDSIVSQAANIRYSQYDYRQSAIVCAVKHKLPHNGEAHQFFMPSGPLAILPLQGEKSSLVWTLDQKSASRIFALNDKEFLTELKRPFGTRFGEISLIGKRFIFPLQQSLAERLVGPRSALLGESAHGLHPLAGQGLNLGFRDAATLAEVLGTATRRGEDIGSVRVLDQYQSWRRFDITLFAAVTDGCNWLYSNKNPFLQVVRGGGMSIIDRLPIVKRSIIYQAAGLHGDLPKTMLLSFTNPPK